MAQPNENNNSPSGPSPFAANRTSQGQEPMINNFNHNTYYTMTFQNPGNYHCCLDTNPCPHTMAASALRSRNPSPAVAGSGRNLGNQTAGPWPSNAPVNASWNFSPLNVDVNGRRSWTDGVLSSESFIIDETFPRPVFSNVGLGSAQNEIVLGPGMQREFEAVFLAPVASMFQPPPSAPSMNNLGNRNGGIISRSPNGSMPNGTGNKDGCGPQ